MTRHAGIDLGGTHAKLALTDDAGRVLLQRQASIPEGRGVEDVLEVLVALARECREAADGPIASLGLTMPCVLDPDDGAVRLIPNFPQEWIGIRFGALLEAQCGMPVSVLNDARAAAYAELRLGAGKGLDDFVVLILGTGVGGGLVLGGELWTGARGVAGEIGHMTVVPGGLPCGCGNRGCLETVASGPALTAEAARIVIQGLPTSIRGKVNGDVGRITPAVIDEAACEGDEAATDILRRAAAAIRTALLGIRALINPQALVLGGGVGRSEALLRLLRADFRHEHILFPGDLGSVELRPAAFSQWAGAIGASIWGKDRSLRHAQAPITFKE